MTLNIFKNSGTYPDLSTNSKLMLKTFWSFLTQQTLIEVQYENTKCQDSDLPFHKSGSSGQCFNTSVLYSVFYKNVSQVWIWQGPKIP